MKRTCGMIVVSLGILAFPLCAEDWTKESKDRSKRAALHNSVQQVRGDSGNWNDDARLSMLRQSSRSPPSCRWTPGPISS